MIERSITRGTVIWPVGSSFLSLYDELKESSRNMTSEVIIDVQPKEISIALLEDKSLVEYQNEPREASFAVGNIYLD